MEETQVIRRKLIHEPAYDISWSIDSICQEFPQLFNWDCQLVSKNNNFFSFYGKNNRCSLKRISVDFWHKRNRPIMKSEIKRVHKGTYLLMERNYFEIPNL